MIRLQNFTYADLLGLSSQTNATVWVSGCISCSNCSWNLKINLYYYLVQKKMHNQKEVTIGSLHTV